MHNKERYVVRVTSIEFAAGLFTWELCRADGLEVIQRSTKSFSTRIEALFDSAPNPALLAPEAIWQLLI